MQGGEYYDKISSGHSTQTYFSVNQAGTAVKTKNMRTLNFNTFFRIFNEAKMHTIFQMNVLFICIKLILIPHIFHLNSHSSQHLYE